MGSGSFEQQDAPVGRHVERVGVTDITAISASTPGASLSAAAVAGLTAVGPGTPLAV
jgi:hypothetical protein